MHTSERTFFSSKLFLAAFIFAVLFGAARFVPAAVWSPVQSVAQFVLSPFVRVGSAAGYIVRDARETIANLGNLKAENESLRQENLRLLGEVARRDQAASENDELRRNLNLLPQAKESLIPATIIGRDQAGLANTFLLDVGEANDVRVGMPVVVEAGVLIGRVEKVFANTAVVRVITAEESIINVETTSGAVRGVARGDKGLAVKLDMVEQNKELHDGDGLVTSGLGGELPRGLLLGTIHDIRLSDDKLFQQATVQLPVDIHSLRFVFVVKP
jgi:rod shape-determining protein MreC